jgi:3-oxoadipate enol-lactonase
MRFYVTQPIQLVGNALMNEEKGYLEVPGGRLYYEVTGSGHPLVLIHAGVANLRMWDSQVPVFAKEYRVIRYDTRGYGRTETDDVSFSNRADLAALLDHLDEPSAYVLGISRGGIIALDFTLEQPDRVDALIVAAGGIGGLQMESNPESEAMWAEVERMYEAHEWERLADFETAFWVDGPGQSFDRVGLSIRDRVHDWILSNYRAEKPWGKAQPLDPPAAGRLDEIRVPTLVLIGDLDEKETQAACHHLASNVPNGRLEIFHGCAHMLNLEQPERFNRVVLEFLPK